jgi:hypothetical protein
MWYRRSENPSPPQLRSESPAKARRRRMRGQENSGVEHDYREPYPAWILVGMDVLAAGILIASFRDAWAVVKSLGADADTLANSIVAGAVVLAIDAAILLLEQARSQVKIRGGKTWASDVWVLALIVMSAILNVRYLTKSAAGVDLIIGAILGVAIPSTIAVLGYIKGDMLAYNAQLRRGVAPAPRLFASPYAHRLQPATEAALRPSIVKEESRAAEVSPMFRLRRKANAPLEESAAA